MLLTATMHTLPVQSAAQSLQDILEKVEPTPPHYGVLFKRWRELPPGEADEAAQILKSIWDLPQTSVVGYDYRLRVEFERVFQKVRGIDDFVSDWRPRYGSRGLMDTQYEPSPHTAWAYDAAGWVLTEWENDALENLISTSISKELEADARLTQIEVYSALLDRTRETDRHPIVLNLLQELRLKKWDSHHIVSSLIAEEAMQLCDLELFDAMIDTQAPTVYESYLRHRITGGDASQVLGQHDQPDKLSALMGYNAILRFGYC